jgi:hypothetical protein
MSRELQYLPLARLCHRIARLAGFWTWQMMTSALHISILGTVDIFGTTTGIPTLSIEDEAGSRSVRQKTTLAVG